MRQRGPQGRLARRFVSTSRVLNWQCVAGTGTEPGPQPVVQGKRFDPYGTYVSRWVPELAGPEGKFSHEPWRLKATDRAGFDSPDPIVDLMEARARFEQARGI